MLNKKQCLLLAMVIAVTVSSCAHTKVVGTWKDPEHQGYPRKIFVYGLSRSADVKIITENLLVQEFEKHGISALASHKFLPHDLAIDKEALKKIVQEQGIDTIFIGGPMNRKELETLRPGSVSYQEATVDANPEDDFYGTVAGYMYTPGTYAQEEVAWQIILYDVASRKKIWSAQFETFVEYSAVKEIRPTVKRIMEMIVADKMIP